MYASLVEWLDFHPAKWKLVPWTCRRNQALVEIPFLSLLHFLFLHRVMQDEHDTWHCESCDKDVHESLVVLAHRHWTIALSSRDEDAVENKVIGSLTMARNAQPQVNGDSVMQQK